MSDFDIYNQNANAMRKAFEDAESTNKGYISKEFDQISAGDIVFNKKKATHVMVATGQIREKLSAKGKVIGLEIEIMLSKRSQYE